MKTEILNLIKAQKENLDTLVANKSLSSENYSGRWNELTTLEVSIDKLPNQELLGTTNRRTIENSLENYKVELEIITKNLSQPRLSPLTKSRLEAEKRQVEGFISTLKSFISNGCKYFIEFDGPAWLKEGENGITTDPNKATWFEDEGEAKVYLALNQRDGRLIGAKITEHLFL